MTAMTYDMGVWTSMKDLEMSRFHPENGSLLTFNYVLYILFDMYFLYDFILYEN